MDFEERRPQFSRSYRVPFGRRYSGDCRGSIALRLSKNGFAYRCPDAAPWLTWAEHQGATKIDDSSMSAMALGGGLMTEISPPVLSHHVWGFLQHCLSGSARQTFMNTARRDGFNVWRLLVLKINSQTDCRRLGLRDQAQCPSSGIRQRRHRAGSSRLGNNLQRL